MKNKIGHQLIIGCNYHTTWQSHPAMRFILTELRKNKAKLETRQTKRKFWTDIDDLIFINSPHNKQKAQKLNEQRTD